MGNSAGWVSLTSSQGSIRVRSLPVVTPMISVRPSLTLLRCILAAIAIFLPASSAIASSAKGFYAFGDRLHFGFGFGYAN
jgi:hypothetical protein